jgi:tRNA (cytidine56-2'-O)-methyltransferase
MLSVMRLGHRISRDKRITTHVFLTSRALGAEKGYLSGEKDDAILSNTKDISDRWGGGFQVEYVKDWKKFISDFKGTVVHLTMYGMPVQDKIPQIRKHRDILVIVGGEKVPAEVYELADFNVAVTNQPHSEVAALGVFLDQYFEGSELKNEFPDAKQRIVPNERGKSFV